MDIDINSVPGHGGEDNNVDLKSQADSTEKILKASSESLKVVQYKL